MRARVLLLVPIAAAIAVAGASARPAKEPQGLTQTSIGGAPLGLPQGAYVRYFGRIGPVEHLENGYVRRRFASARTVVFFRESGGGAIGIVTWNPRFRDAAGIGPCVRVADLRAAFGTRVAAALRIGGKVVVYRLGRLYYRADAPTIGAVMLATRALGPFAVTNEESCSSSR